MYCFILLYAYLYLEIFHSVLVTNLFKLNYIFNIKNINKPNLLNLKANLSNYISYLFVFCFITFKETNANLFVVYVLIYIIISLFQNNHNVNKNYIKFLNLNIIMFLYLLSYINNFITLYIFIELYSTIFFFFFLNIDFDVKNTLLIKYKNSLLMYLFSNFLTSMLYLFGLSYIVFFFGTINFLELNFLNKFEPKWELIFILISFLIKLALPGFHFLKIELYKYLTVEYVVYFSIITLFINFMFTLLLFNQGIIFIILKESKVINFLLLTSLMFFFNKLKLSNTQEFIAYSGFATNNLILLNFLI